ncbi:hypothetical protein [Acetobacterium sp.]|jgi:hypothetical protein|uniref:RDAC family protein n=1 Tax=Acetobacterium sp. TaxID=1872094 RepID=UPI000CB956B7|nr:hypothetical protein [Acetobacterium sp.]MDO9490665.1 hypothetical protein [Acetobacterium sp.]PKM72659.1 MAG: hypothetical protein CVU92_07315 [Firmicutes bacterium HGW-Firmicutes-17]
MIITWNNISEVNRRIEERDLAYKVHLSDACGGQSMWIEAMDKANHFDNLDDLNDLIKGYFSEIHADVEFSWDKKSFWSKDRSLII